MYFYEFNCSKTFEIVIDIPKGIHMPEIVDLMFKKFEAKITFQSVFTLDDLKKDAARKKMRTTRSGMIGVYAKNVTLQVFK